MKNKCVGVQEGCKKILYVVFGADCGLVDKNDLHCDIDNIILCARVQKTDVVELLKWFVLM